MHLQQSIIITTPCQQESSQKVSTERVKITDFHSQQRKCHKNYSYCDMKKNVVRHAQARCENWHPQNASDCLHHIVISVCMRCGVFVFVCMHV